MNHPKVMQLGFGVAVVCLLLTGILFQSTSGREVVRASGEGGGNDELYLPVVMRPLTPTINRVSVASDGTQADNSSYIPSISPDGRYVTYSSGASNLVSGDTSLYVGIFIHDRQTGQTSRVSVASDGTQGNSDSWISHISADGRYIAFGSWAINLVSDDTNGYVDTFIHDRQTGQTSRVSVASNGTQGNSDSWPFAISADGRYIVFGSDASNLVSGDTNSTADVFVHDQVTGQTSRISVTSDGTGGNHVSWNSSISADGRYVVFDSSASNLVSDDTNGVLDIFVHDRQTGQTSRISVASDGIEGNGESSRPSISADGRYVAFPSYATNLVSNDTNVRQDIFVHDQQTGQTTRVSVASDGTEGEAHSGYPSISPDGRYVAFDSFASNLVSSDTNGTDDVFVHDRQTGQTSRITIAYDGTEGNDRSQYPSISADGRYIAIWSVASNLVSGDTNDVDDIFVYDQRK